MVMNVNSTKFNAKADTEEKRAKVRHALTLLINRELHRRFGRPGRSGTHELLRSDLLTDSDSGKTEFVNKNGVNGDGKGYYSVAAKDYTANVAEAVSLLKEVGYTYDESTRSSPTSRRMSVTSITPAMLTPLSPRQSRRTSRMSVSASL